MSAARRWLGPVLMALLLGWSLWLILGEQSPAQLLAALAGAHVPFLLLGAGCMAVFVGCEAACTHLVLGTLGTPAPYRRCLGYSCTGFYFSTVTPSSSGGQPMQVYAMAQDGIPAAHGTLDMLLITICYQLAAVLYALGALILFPGRLASLGTGLTALVVFGLAVTLALTALMILILVRPNWCRRAAMGLLALLVRIRLVKHQLLWTQKLEAGLERYRQGGQLLRSRPFLLLQLLALTVVQLGALYLVPWTVYRALGLSACSPVELAALQALAAMAVMLLPLPGSAGAAEAAFLLAFSTPFGSLAAPGAVLSRGISCYGAMAVTGVVTLLLCRKNRSAAKNRIILLKSIE